MNPKYRGKPKGSFVKRHLILDFSILLFIAIVAVSFFAFSGSIGQSKLSKNITKDQNTNKQPNGSSSQKEALKNQNNSNNLSSNESNRTNDTNGDSLLQKPQLEPANTVATSNSALAPNTVAPAPPSTPTDPCNYSLKTTYTQQRNAAITAENNSYNSEASRLASAIQSIVYNYPDYWTNPEYTKLINASNSLPTSHNNTLAQIESTYQANVASAGCSL